MTVKISDNLREVLERSADRLGEKWTTDGNSGFYPTEDSYNTEKLCVMDTIGLLIQVRCREQNPQGGMDYLRAVVALASELGAVLPLLAREAVAGIDRNRQDGDEAVRRFVDASDDIGKVMWYNDHYCQGGDEAADLIRRTLKETV